MPDPPDLSSHWPGLILHEQPTEGARSEVWFGTLGGERVVARKSRRSAASLDWEIDLLAHLHVHGVRVPRFVPTAHGALRFGVWTVQTFLDGREPDGEADWRLVGAAVRAIHRVPVMVGQRPGACSVTELGAVRRSVDADLDAVPADVLARCLVHFEPFVDTERTIVHGDAHAGNIRIDDAGRVGFIDWDEARIDVPDLDLDAVAGPELPALQRERARNAANAWETLNAWVAEPDYARRRLTELPGA